MAAKKTTPERKIPELELKISSLNDKIVALDKNVAVLFDKVNPLSVDTAEIKVHVTYIKQQIDKLDFNDITKNCAEESKKMNEISLRVVALEKLNNKERTWLDDMKKAAVVSLINVCIYGLGGSALIYVLGNIFTSVFKVVK